MAQTKYVNQSNDSGERVSTNGYFTGNHVGTVMQDADSSADNDKYSVETNTIRMGTMMQDSQSGQPSQRFKVSYDLNGATGTTPESEYGDDSNKVTASVAPTITAYPEGKEAFSKWNSKSDGTGTDTVASASLTLTADTILYAVYS